MTWKAPLSQPLIICLSEVPLDKACSTCSVTVLQQATAHVACFSTLPLAFAPGARYSQLM